ncbi:hypothetical protein LshimejAT787_3000060 [Lyophyllum shimeji]|uniref:Uncharacterized protein n=1 Tax=Lyophyllum shimeji TaxID=47721 RepID=A0A9P3Q2U3_LYOSH|nr:hypothetical protein LshimejAT787_3000060 [Lyophyllum shimeji]
MSSISSGRIGDANVGRPKGPPRRSLANTPSTVTTRPVDIRWYYPAGKALVNKHDFFTTVILHTLKMVVKHCNAANVDYINSGSPEAPMVLALFKVIVDKSEIVLPEFRDLRSHLPLIASSSTGVLKDTVETDLERVYEDREVKRVIAAVFEWLKGLTCFFPPMHADIIKHIRVPCVDNRKVNFDTKVMMQREPMSFERVTQRFKPSQVKRAASLYFEGPPEYAGDAELCVLSVAKEDKINANEMVSELASKKMKRRPSSLNRPR